MSASIGNNNFGPRIFACEIHDGDLVVTPYRLPHDEKDPHPAMKLGADAPLYSWMDINPSQFATYPKDMSHVVWGAKKVAPNVNGESFSGFVVVRPGVNQSWLVYDAPKVETKYVKSIMDRTPAGPFAVKQRPLERIIGLNTQKIARHDAKLASAIDGYARAAGEFVQRRYRFHGPAVDGLDEAYALALNNTRNARHSAINWVACIISPTASMAHRAEAWRELREHENFWLEDRAMRKATRTLMVGLADYLTRREGVETARQVRSLRPARTTSTSTKTAELEPA